MRVHIALTRILNENIKIGQTAETLSRLGLNDKIEMGLDTTSNKRITCSSGCGSKSEPHVGLNNVNTNLAELVSQKPIPSIKYDNLGINEVENQ